MIKSILIDASHFASPLGTGVELYTRSLLPNLVSLLHSKGIQVFLVGHEPKMPNGLPSEATWISSPHRRFWSQVALLQLLQKHKPELFFSPSGLPPLLYRGKTVLTIHDLAAYTTPESFTLGQLLRLRWLNRFAARRAVQLIVPSSFTSKLVQKVWKIQPAKISLIPHGPRELAASIEPLSLPSHEPIFLYVGRIEWKKNLMPLIEGFSKLLKEYSAQLILVGKDGYGSREVRKLVASLPSEQRSKIIFPGYINEEQKHWLYKEAFTIVVPGKAEGFGFPVLEAFSTKVPVICAQSGSLPEVAQDGALYAQADIGTDWYLQMKKITEDSELRRQLIQLGQERLKDFSWKKATEETAMALAGMA